MIARTNCPHCGRPMGFEYREVEAGVCHLWRLINEPIGPTIAARTITDCFTHTSRRLRELAAELADTKVKLAGAQRALSRHHAAEVAKDEPFRDGARIE